MAELTKNFAVSTIATAPSPATSGTSLVVGAGHGARFDSAVDHNCVVCPADAQPTPANAEIVRVTAISTDTFTITRAQEGSTARSIVVGDRIYAGPTVKMLTDLDAANALVATAVQNLAAAYQPITIQPPVQRVSAAGALTRGAVNLSAAPPTFVASGTANAILFLIPVVAAEMNVSGRTTKLITKLQVGTNGTAPGINFTAALYPISASGGASDSQNYTWSTTPATNSTATINAPSINTFPVASSTAYDLPADGTYILLASTSGTMATNARATIHMSLWSAYV